MENSFEIICPNCGTRLYAVSTGENSTTECPICSTEIATENSVKNRDNDAALSFIENVDGLCENFATAVIDNMMTDDNSPKRVGRDLAKALRENNASDVLLALTGWSLDSILDLTEPVVAAEASDETDKEEM